VSVEKDCLSRCSAAWGSATPAGASDFGRMAYSSLRKKVSRWPHRKFLQPRPAARAAVRRRLYKTTVRFYSHFVRWIRAPKGRKLSQRFGRILNGLYAVGWSKRVGRGFARKKIQGVKWFRPETQFFALTGLIAGMLSSFGDM
jgi:hypothetical protein